jgi:hypothetical protein
VGAITVVLPTGREILIPADGPQPAGDTAGTGPAVASEYQDVAFHLEFKQIVDTAKEIAEMFHHALESAKPKRAALELSLGVDARTGTITAFFVDGGGSGKIKITLEWGSEGAS